MKKSWNAQLAALFMLAASAPAGEAAQEPRVVVTIAPIHSLAASLMEGVGSPGVLVTGGASPHSYSLRPSQARALSKARVVVRVSNNLESFLVRPIENLASKAQVVTLIEVKGMIVYESREAGLWDKSQEPVTDARDYINLDPHIWLDPRNAKRIVIAIAATLRKTYPEHGQAFMANAKKLILRLDELDRDLLAVTGPLRGKPYILFHDATRYFDTRYKLAPAGAVTISPDRPAGARRLSKIRKHIKSQGITCVFTEPQFQPKLVQTLIAGTRARSASLDPLGAGISPGPELYFKLMRNLAASLSACLKNSP